MRRENWENVCLVRSGKEGRKWWDSAVLSPGPPKLNISKWGRKLKWKWELCFGQNCPTQSLYFLKHFCIFLLCFFIYFLVFFYVIIPIFVLFCFCFCFCFFSLCLSFLSFFFLITFSFVLIFSLVLLFFSFLLCLSFLFSTI